MNPSRPGTPARRRPPGAARFASEWRERAHRIRGERPGRLDVENVPVQALRIGDLRIVALPGESFTGIAARVRRGLPSTWEVGCANGSVGCLPTRGEFSDPRDDACYCTPRFTTIFPFDAGVEDLIVGESRALISAVSTR